MSNLQFNKNVVELQINGEGYIATLDVRTAMHYKKAHNKPILTGIQEAVSNMDEVETVFLLGSIIRKDLKSTPVGADFFFDYSPIAIMENLAPVLADVLNTNLPEGK